MQVEWDPENGEDKQVWQFDPDDVLRKDAMLIEKHYGGTWDQWRAGLMTGEINARTVLLWYMLLLIHPKIKFDDVPNFRVRQLKTEMGTLELKQLWKRAERMKMEPDTREAFNSQFEMDMADAMKREGVDGDVEIIDGKLAIEGVVADLPKAQ
jgi:hypothetical protein